MLVVGSKSDIRLGHANHRSEVDDLTADNLRWRRQVEPNIEAEYERRPRKNEVVRPITLMACRAAENKLSNHGQVDAKEGNKGAEVDQFRRARLLQYRRHDKDYYSD